MAEVRSEAASARTDAQGRFTIQLGEPARLRATLVGYRPVAVDAQPGVEIEIALQPDTLRRSDSVSVSAGPFSGEQEVSVALAGNELRNLASVLADDPLRAVQSMPGVAGNDDFRAQFSVRGAGFQRVGVYLDGILIHAPFHTVQGEPTSASLSIIQGELLESANVHVGPLPARYADRTAGALDFRSREGDARRRSARITASASNAGASAEGPLGRNLTWLAAVRKSYLQYIINRTASDEPSLGFSFWDGQGKLAWTPTAAHQVSLTLINGNSGLDRDPTKVNLGVNAIADSSYRYTLAYLGWRYTRSGLLFTQRLGWLDEAFQNDNRNALRLQQGAYREYIWNGDGSRLWNPRLVTEFGWSVRELRDRAYADRVVTGPTPILRIDDYRGSGTRSGVYAQQSVNLTASLQLRFGGRRDYHSANGRGAWLGNAGLTGRAWRGARWHAAWSQTAQYPELLQLFSHAGRRTLEPQRAAQTQLGLEQALGERSRVRLELYNRQDRQLLFQPFGEPRALPNNRFYLPPLITPWQNSSRGYSRGGQVFFQRRAANGVTGWVSYVYNRARLRDQFLSNVILYDADSEAHHLFQLYASQRLRATVNLSAKWVYGSGMPIPGFYQQRGPHRQTDVFLSAQRNLLRLPAYQRTDVRVNKSFVRKRYQFTLFAEVINLTNRNNLRFDDYGNIDPRTGRARLFLKRTFPILPSAGIVFDF